MVSCGGKVAAARNCGQTAVGEGKRLTSGTAGGVTGQDRSMSSRPSRNQLSLCENVVKSDQSKSKKTYEII